MGFGNPDLLEALSRSAPGQRLTCRALQFIVTGGAPVPGRLIRKFRDRGVTLHQGYGLSEAAPLVLLVDPAHALPGRWVRPAGPHPWWTSGSTVRMHSRRTGETGELLVRGPNVWPVTGDGPAEDMRVINADGWLRTGDAARIDRRATSGSWTASALASWSGGAPSIPATWSECCSRILTWQKPPLPRRRAPVGSVVAAAFVVLTSGNAVTEEELLAFCRARLPAHMAPARICLVRRPAAAQLRRQAAAE